MYRVEYTYQHDLFKNSGGRIIGTTIKENKGSIEICEANANDLNYIDSIIYDKHNNLKFFKYTITKIEKIIVPIRIGDIVQHKVLNGYIFVIKEHVPGGISSIAYNEMFRSNGLIFHEDVVVVGHIVQDIIIDGTVVVKANNDNQDGGPKKEEKTEAESSEEIDKHNMEFIQEICKTHFGKLITMLQTVFGLDRYTKGYRGQKEDQRKVLSLLRNKKQERVEDLDFLQRQKSLNYFKFYIGTILE